MGQYIVGSVYPCTRCGERVFHEQHPHTRKGCTWLTYFVSKADVEFLRQLNISAT